MRRPSFHLRLCLCCVALASLPAHAAPAPTLANGALTARFGDRGLESIADPAAGGPYRFTHDGFGVAIDGRTFDSDTLPAPARTLAAGSVTYAWTAGLLPPARRLRAPAGLAVRQQTDLHRHGARVAAACRCRHRLPFVSRRADRLDLRAEGPASEPRHRRLRHRAASRRRARPARRRAEPLPPRRARRVGIHPRLPARHGLEPRRRTVRGGPWAAGALPPDRADAPRHHAAGVDAGADECCAGHGQGRDRRLHAHGARVPARESRQAHRRLRRLDRQRLPDRRRHARGPRGVQARARPRGRHRRRVRAVRAVRLEPLPPRGERRRLELGARALVRPRPEDPEGRVGSPDEPRPAVRAGDARLRDVEAPRPARLRLSGPPLLAEPGVARARPPARHPGGEPRLPQPAGLADRRAGRLPRPPGDCRLRVRLHLPDLQRPQPLRAVAGLAPRDGDAPPPHPRHRDRRPAGIPVLRTVELAGGQLPAPDVHRRAARELRPLPRPALRPGVGRSRALHGLLVQELRVRAERDRARLHDAPDLAQRRNRRHAVDAHQGPRRGARPLPRARLGRLSAGATRSSPRLRWPAGTTSST